MAPRAWDRDSWCAALSASAKALNADALALLRGASSESELVAASTGAPSEFLNLCFALNTSPGVVHAGMVGDGDLGGLAWARMGAGRARVSLFALYRQRFSRARLRSFVRVASACVDAQMQFEQARGISCRGNFSGGAAKRARSSRCRWGYK